MTAIGPQLTKVEALDLLEEAQQALNEILECEDIAQAHEIAERFFSDE